MWHARIRVRNNGCCVVEDDPLVMQAVVSRCIRAFYGLLRESIITLNRGCRNNFHLRVNTPLFKHSRVPTSGEPLNDRCKEASAYIRWWNEKRTKGSRGYLSPIEYHESLRFTT
ncbi:IS3 family transposase [Burkholderia cepacia]|uniref:IS3 family transposase n=1 Tax=Burkholderia cepacia TaxID=292 RepID=UPI003FA3B678